MHPQVMTGSIAPRKGRWSSFADTARPIAGVVAIVTMVAHNVIAQKNHGVYGSVAGVLAVLWLFSIVVFVATLVGRPFRWGIGTVLRWVGGFLWVFAGVGTFVATLGLVGDHFGTFASVMLILFLSPLVFPLAPFYMLWKDHDWTLILFLVEGFVGWLVFVLGAFLCARANAKRGHG
jgi:hypothetical protein